MGWATSDAGRLSWADATAEVVVDLGPFHLRAANARTGRGFVTSLAPATGGPGEGAAPGTSSPRPGLSLGKAPVSYRVAADVLGSYAGLGPRPRWFGFTTASVEDMSPDRLRLRLTGSQDPVARECCLTIHCGAEGRVGIEASIEPAAVVAETAVSFELGPDSSFFGFGERFARWDHRGHEVDIWTEDSPYGDDTQHNWTYWPLPYVVTRAGSGLVVGTSVRTRFCLGTEHGDAWSVSAEQNHIDLSLLLCETPRQVVEAFTAAHGRPPVPPPWGLGVWKTMLGGDERVDAEARRMEQENLPFNAVWIYDQLEPQTNSGWGAAMGYPEGEYPDIPGLVGRLHARGHKVLGYLNPQFLSGTTAFLEGDQRGYFLRSPSGGTYLLPCPDPGTSGETVRQGLGALLDPTNPGAVSWWSDMLRRLLSESGYDGWMHDFGEYTPADAVAFDGRTGALLRNSYPVEYQRPCAEVVARHKPEAVFFVRSGYLGSTALCPAVWPGDQHTEWAGNRGLRGVLRAGLSLSLAGVNAFGPDIGGFFGTDAPEHNEMSAELWIRWCQFGALCPLMRDHLGFKRRPGVPVVDLWHDETTIGTWRHYAELHLALLPYLYGLAHDAHRTGVASVRPLLLEFPADPVAWALDDQYMLGPALLVAPVLEEGARRRRVYFPAGRWYGFFDDDVYPGPGWHDVDAPLDRIPLFVREGTVLPLSRRPWQPADELRPEDLLADLELRAYPAQGEDGPTTFKLHDGTVVRMARSGAGLDLQVEATVAVPPAAPARHYQVRLPRGSGFSRARRVTGGTEELVALADEGMDRWWGSGGSAVPGSVPPVAGGQPALHFLFGPP